MRLSYKIYILAATFSLLVISSLSALTYYFTRTLLIEEQYSAYTKLAEFSSKRIDYFLYGKIISAKIIASRIIVLDALSGASKSRLIEISESLAATKDIDPDIAGIYIIDRNKEIVASSDSGLAIRTLSDLSVQDEILGKVFQGHVAYSDVFMSRNLGGPTMIFAVPVYDSSTKELIGAVEVYLDWLSVLRLLKDTGTTFVHLINRNGIEIGSNEDEHYEDILGEDYSQSAIYKDFISERSRPVEILVDEDLHGGFQSIIIHTHLPGYSEYGGNDWILVLEESVDSVFGAINRNSAIISVSGFIFMLLLSLLMLYFLRRYIVEPLGKFSEISERITSGEMNLRLPEFGKDEIGQLARSFNLMVDRFQELNLSLASKIREKTDLLEKELQASEYKTEDLEKNKAAILNLLEDVSIEKERTSALVLELNKFELAVENSYEQIVITDIEGIVVYANKSAERITGYSRGEIIGNKPSLWGGQMPKEFYASMWKTIKADKKVFLGQLKNKRKTGEIYDVDVQISPIIDRDGNLKFFVAIERDITEQKKLEDARTNFISVASHQLRTPLTSIKWISEILMSGDTGPIPDKQKEFVNDLYLSSNRMIELVNSLLNIARIESTELRIKGEKIDFSTIYAGVIKEFESVIQKKKLSISLEIGEGISEWQSDSRLLFEVLKNLISNSIKYTRDGGKIKVRVEKRDREILISVQDNGIGIPRPQQDRVFTKFFRGDNAVKINTDGTGLGMYIVKSLVDLLNGRIWFESEEDKGTTFYVALPESGPKENTGSKSLVSIR